MNKIIGTLLVSCLFLAGCESRTEYGKCVGIGDKQNPALVYKVSTRNVVIGVIFFEMVLPPIFVALDETYCPIDKAQ